MISTVLYTIARVLAAATALLTFPASLYLAAVALASRLAHDRHPEPPDQARVLVLVPAHEEEAVLGDALESIVRMSAAGSKPEILVLADNCSDGTAAVARRHGVRVLERDDPENPGKGPALHWALGQPGVLNDVDYVFLVDADSLPETEALDVALARAQETHADIVQLPFISRGKVSDDRSAMNVWTTTLMNRVRPRGLTALGLPCRLQGGGILLRSWVARRHGWPAEGVSEDLFATIAFLDEGVHITYADAAVVWARAAETDEAATTQRVRWESGRLRATRLLPRLLVDAVARKSPQHASLVAHLAVPPLTVHVTLIGAGLVASMVTRSRLVWIFGVSAALTGLYLAEGLRLMGDTDLARKALAAGPRFALWKLRVQWKALRRFRTIAWERTPRDEM
ncbi:beta-monoglucosyldiacylglycerol synthase [bacterium BMS3Bbin01]|nr:beta-monoglucosyldiacylglycerol synthase [bacterium BMS3Bbin01]